MADDEREEQEVGPKTRVGAEQAAALDRVTDNVSLECYYVVINAFKI